jgi:bifunctional ADP-heptose synthase (sugar kinase/adenylyltransferase)
MRGISTSSVNTSVVLLDELARDERIGRGRAHHHVGLAVDDLGHQTADQRRVVDAQHFDLLHCGHASYFLERLAAYGLAAF